MRKIIYPLVTEVPCGEDAENVVHASSQGSFLKCVWRGVGGYADTRSEERMPTRLSYKV